MSRTPLVRDGILSCQNVEINLKQVYNLQVLTL